MLATDRLLLRRWNEEDCEPFAAMNADPRVMEFMPECLTRAESDVVAEHIEAHFARYGFGLFTAGLRATGEFIGFIGPSVPTFDAHFTPCVEIGWRLTAAHWNQGLATEGAGAALEFAFDALRQDEIVSFTVVANSASRRVMEKLGMTHNAADDFDHPGLELGHALRQHVLYRIARSKWLAARRLP